MADLVERLREHRMTTDWQVAVREAHEAADTIARLTAGVVRLRSLLVKAIETLDMEGLENTAQNFRASLTTPAPGWKPTHRHVGRGTVYTVVGEATLQTTIELYDYEPLVIYRGEDGQLWARPTSEFNDGRFEALTTQEDKSNG